MRAAPNRQPSGNPRHKRDDRDYSPTPGEVMRCVVLWIRGFHWNREKPKVTDWVVVTLTLAVAVAAFWSAWIFQGQLTESRRFTEISERPWLSVEVSPANNGVMWAKDNAPNVSLKLSVKNVGKSIAKGVQIDWKAYPNTISQIPIPTDARKQQEALCDPPQLHNFGQFDLFPSDHPIVREMSNGTTAAEISAHSTPLSSDSKRTFVGLYVVGCVSYHYSFATDLHQTFFAYNLIKGAPRDKNGNPLILSNGTPLVMGFEVGVNTSDIGMFQDLFARNDAY